MKTEPGSVSQGTTFHDDLVVAVRHLLPDIMAETYAELSGDFQARYWEDRICQYLDDIAPTGHYFGIHPDDDTDFGFWPCYPDDNDAPFSWPTEKLTVLEADAIKLAEFIVTTSLYWTGADEEKSPFLKKARTLAGIVLDDAKARCEP